MLIYIIILLLNFNTNLGKTIEIDIEELNQPGQSPFDRPDIVSKTLENLLVESLLHNLKLYFKYTLLKNIEPLRYPLYFSRVINLFMRDMQPSHKNIILIRRLYYEDSNEDNSTATSIDEYSD